MEITKEIESLLLENEAKYGETNQLIVCIEELSELQKELCKMLRVDAKMNNDALAEEMADVEIALATIKTLMGNESRVERWIKRKLQRMCERL